MMIILVATASFLVGIQPAPGVGGGPQRVVIEAHDANTAKRLAQAQYGRAYKVYDVRQINTEHRRP